MVKPPDSFPPALPADFYSRPTLAVAKDLLGKQLTTCVDGELTGGVIVEVEAYIGPDDPAAHSYRGLRTARTEVLFDPGGHAYVYRIYGLLIAEEIVGTGGRTPLRVGVVNREREATPAMPSWNVIIVTTGIARRWFQNGDILPHDTLIIDEIHQTSAELELCLALGKRVGCRFIWLSATVDPALYARYLNSADVLAGPGVRPRKVDHGCGRAQGSLKWVWSRGRKE